MIDGVLIPTFVKEAFKVEQSKAHSQYDFVRLHIRGFIEPVELQLGDGIGAVSMYVNEEGKLLGLPINKFANLLVRKYARHLHLQGDFIVGTAIIVGSLDGEGLHNRLTEQQVQAISRVIPLWETTTNN